MEKTDSMDKLSQSSPGVIYKDRKRKRRSNQIPIKKRRICSREESFCHELRSYTLEEVEYQELKYVGSGSYGEIFECFQSNLAIKKIKLIDQNCLEYYRRMLCEMKIATYFNRNCPHENSKIVRFKDFIKPKNLNLRNFDKIYLMFERMDCTLEQLVRKYKINENSIKCLSHELLEGIDEIHRSGIIHRDLKPGNIMIKMKKKQFPVVKIIDFGLACSKNENPCDRKVQTLWYRAPELLNFRGKVYYDESIDMWSFGVILAEIILGKILFKGSSVIDMSNKIAEFFSKDFQSHFINCPPLLLDLLRKTLVLNPNNRISAEEALNHDFFRGMKRNLPPFIGEKFTFNSREFNDINEIKRTMIEEIYRSQVYDTIFVSNLNVTYIPVPLSL